MSPQAETERRQTKSVRRYPRNRLLQFQRAISRGLGVADDNVVTITPCIGVMYGLTITV